DGTPDRAGLHRVAVLVEADEARLGDRGRHRMEAVERPGVGHQPRTFLLEDLPDGPVAQLGMRVRPGPGDAAVQEPGVELRVGPEPRPRYEEPTPDHPDLVLDLSLLPARRRGAGDRVDQVVPAHLLEAAIVGAIPTHED